MWRTKFLISFITFVVVFASKGRCEDTFDTAQLRPEIRGIVNCMDSLSQPEVETAFSLLLGYKSPRKRIENQYGGEGGRSSPLYKHFQTLARLANTAELSLLNFHPNGAVRYYAASALAIDSSTDLLQLAIDHIQDTERVLFLDYCIGEEKLVGDLVINKVTPGFDPWKGCKLSQSELTTLDSLLICAPNTLESRFDALRRVLPLEYLYEPIREFVMNTQNPIARIALARYQRVEDVELILGDPSGESSNSVGMVDTYKAIQLFPAPQYLPILDQQLAIALKSNQLNSDWSELYEAIACYENKKAAEILYEAMNSDIPPDVRKHHANFLFDALSRHQLAVFDNLMWQLWEQEYKIDSHVLKYLSSKAPNQTLKIAKESLTTLESVYYANVRNGSMADGGFATWAVIDYVLENDRPFALTQLSRVLRDADAGFFHFLVIKAETIRDDSFIEPLFSRLQRESKPSACLDAARLLIAYRDTSPWGRLRECRSINDSLNTGWGAVAITNLFKENGIE
jgi:hypothetical protein